MGHYTAKLNLFLPAGSDFVDVNADITNNFQIIENILGSILDAAHDPAVVHNTGNETIAGVKTFSSAPVVPDGSFVEAKVTNLVSDLAAKAADSAVVHITGDQTIAGIKTFSSAPVVPDASFVEAKVTNLVSDLAAKAADSAVVHITGDQTIAGIKTFSSAPVVPAAAFPESAVTNLTTDLVATEKTANKGAVSGYMGLDASSRGAQNPKLHAATHVPGAADPLTYSLTGTNAATPSASAANNGLFYYATDTTATLRSNGTTWVQTVPPTGTYASDVSAARIPAYSTYMVDPINGSDANNGKSWGRALATVGAAITAIYADGATGHGYKAMLFLGPGQHLIGTVASATVGLTVTQNVHVIGCSPQLGSANQGGSELVYLGTGIAVETAFNDASGWSAGTLQDLAITNGGSGTIGLHVRNAQNQAEINRVRVGSSSNANNSFSTNALLVDSTDGTQQYPGFVKFRQCWFTGGAIVVKVTAGVTQGMFDTCGVDSDDLTTIGFNLVTGGGGDSGFDLTLLGFKMELHNGISTAPTGALVIDSTAGQVDAGTHLYAVSVVTATGESPLSPVSSTVTADGTHTKVTVTMATETSNISVAGRVLSRKLYRTAAGTTTPFKLLATIGDNSTTSYADTTADASLGASYGGATAMDAVPYQFDANSNITLIGCSARQVTMGTKSAYKYTPAPTGPGFPRLTLLNCHALNTARWLELTNLVGVSTPYIGAALSANTVYTDSFFGMGQTYFRRMSGGGSTGSSSNFAASAGWGSTASISSVLSRSMDQRGTVTVTAGGTGTTANPTITFTFIGGSWIAAPHAIVKRNGGSDQPTVEPTWTTTTTTLVITFPGTPIAGGTYTFSYMVMG